MSRLDWPGLIKAGLRGLGLRPDEFWQLTPAELALMMGDTCRAGPLKRDGLDALLAAYPDHKKDERHART